MDSSTDQTTGEEGERTLRGFGEYLARLLVASSLSDEQKEAWAALVPEMTVDQMGRLANVLERYVDQSALPGLNELRVKLEAIKQAFDAKILSAAEEAKAGLDAVMAEVKAAEAQP